ncbi:MAG: EthD family reductase [Chloroflexota bacterium]
MYKLMIFFQTPKDPDRFQRNWQIFLGMVEKLPGVQGEVITRFEKPLYGGIPFHMLHEVYFETREALDEALKSTAGQAAGMFLQNVTGGRVSILAAEHQFAKPEDFKRRKNTPA